MKQSTNQSGHAKERKRFLSFLTDTYLRLDSSGFLSSTAILISRLYTCHRSYIWLARCHISILPSHLFHLLASPTVPVPQSLNIPPFKVAQRLPSSMPAATLASTTTSSTRPSLQLSEGYSEPSITCTNVYALCFNILDILTPSPGPSSIRSGFHPSHRTALTEANSPNVVKVSRQLHDVICAIQNTVEQLLQRSSSTSSLESRLASLQKTLSATCADLHVLREAFGKGSGKLLSSLAIGLGILPVSITHLNRDLKLLSDQHAQLEAAMHLVERVRGYNFVIPARSRRAAASLASDACTQPQKRRSSHVPVPWTRYEKTKSASQKVSQKMKVDVLTDLPASPREARRFWDTFIGDEVGLFAGTNA